MPTFAALALILLTLLTVGAARAPIAAADGPVGHDPAANLPIGPVPDSCGPAPTAADCIDGVVTDLDQARAALGLGPYRLPSTFVSLTAAEQAFVLTDLDRVSAGLAPIAGLTAPLSADAALGIANDTDPASSDPSFGYWTANWAGGYPNIVMAYYDWMYDDGPGSGNLDCTVADATGCWGHRHDILWQFDGSGPLALGAASGVDPGGQPGYAMLLGEGDSSYRPAYAYTWSEAVAAGANGGQSGAAPGAASPASRPASRPARSPSPARATASRHRQRRRRRAASAPRRRRAAVRRRRRRAVLTPAWRGRAALPRPRVPRG